MVKQKKKRTKKYSGVDAVVTQPIVTHISAANRSKISQWWFERKQFLKPILITTGVVIVVIIVILEIVHIATGG